MAAKISISQALHHRNRRDKRKPSDGYPVANAVHLLRLLVQRDGLADMLCKHGLIAAP